MAPGKLLCGRHLACVLKRVNTWQVQVVASLENHIGRGRCAYAGNLQLRVEDFGQRKCRKTPFFLGRASRHTVYEARGDGIEVDPRVEALAARRTRQRLLRPGLRSARRALHVSGCGIIYGFRRQPRVSDISDGRLKELTAAAAPTIRELRDGGAWPAPNLVRTILLRRH